jgi:hypothetical protein
MHLPRLRRYRQSRGWPEAAPYSGDNYRAYSALGFLLGRTFVHSSVRNAMRDAYADLSKSHPELRFVYAESGWPWGGGFAPPQDPRQRHVG